jgi:taurine dioxygenase
MVAPAAGIGVRPLTAAVGAEIDGVDLTAPVDDATVAAIRQALLDHLVIFFRNQPITPEQHLAFAQRFGPVNPGVATRVTDMVPGITVLDQVAPVGLGTDTWHSDHLFSAEPPLGTILRAVQLPALGGDTCFASMYDAYEALSPSVQSFLDELTTVNSPAPVMSRMPNFDAYSNDVVKEMPEPVVHPAVRVHPETGRKALWVCVNFTSRIVELSEPESSAVLAMLFEHIKSPQFQCRFHWETDSVAFWDNRAVQHCAIVDYHERRIMHRTMVSGDRPFGPQDERARSTAARTSVPA